MTKIIIVAGGLATRMRPITEEIPKCMIDINGKPLIQHQLEFFRENGFKDIIFCVAHLAGKVKEYFGDGKRFGLNIAYVEETEELRGTAGSVKLAERFIDDDFMVYYGDNLTNMDFHRLLEFHKESKGTATIVVRPAPEGYKGSSVITLDEEQNIKVFIEKPSTEHIQKYAAEKKYINNGIYVLSKEVFKIIPPNTKYDFAKEVFPALIQKNRGIKGYATDEFFREIGRIEKYEGFLQEIRGIHNIFEKRKAAFLDRDGVINENASRLARPEQFKLMEGADEAIKKLNEAGYLTIIVSNQPDIAKGFYTFQELDKIHEKMNTLLKEKGAHIDKIYICPHHPEKGFEGEKPELKIDCECRKPKPGLILKAARENNIDMKKSWMIGDSYTDVAAGQKAGVRTIYLSGGGGSGSKEEQAYRHLKPDIIKKDLLDSVDFLINSK